MIIKSEQTLAQETLPAVEEKAEDVFQDGAAWDIDDEKEEAILVGKEGVNAQETGPNDPPQVPLPIPANGDSDSDQMELLESLQRAYSSFESRYLGPFIRSSCEYANIAPRTAEFVQTPLAISIAFTLACFCGAVILLSLTSLTSLLKTFMYHVFIQGIFFYWKVLGTLLISVVLFFLTSSTLIAGKLVLQAFEPFAGDLRDPAIEILRKAREQDWPAIGKYIQEHLLAATWAAQSAVVQVVQRCRQRRAREIRPRVMKKFKGGRVVIGLVMLVLFTGMNMTFWLVSLGWFLWAKKRRS